CTAEPSANVLVAFWGPGVPTCLALADATTGVFQCSPATPLALGGYQVIAENGDASITSDPISMTIVDANPTITSPTAGSTVPDSRPSVSGTYAGDDVTSILVEHSLDGVTFDPFCTDNSPAAGMWACTPASPELAVGGNILRTTAFVGAANVDQSAPVTLTLAAPTVIGSPSGSAQLGNPQPTVIGTAEPGANITVQFWGPTSTTCSTVANPVTGAFQC